VEELLMAALGEDEPPPILDAFVVSLGYFLGEAIRRNTDSPGTRRPEKVEGKDPSSKPDD
jgi:hypothetical protein